MHLVAANGELTETLDMVSILKGNDIQPPSTLINLIVTADSHVLVYLLFVKKHAESSVQICDNSRTAMYMHCQNFVALIKPGYNATLLYETEMC
jgi:hypothetical protein